MAYVVDTVQVEPENAAAYLRIVETEIVPVMTAAGAGFVSCWSTSTELGEEVSIKTIWSFTDHVEWNVIRKNMVLDPRWYQFSAKIGELRTGGTRRFFYPSSFSPMQ
jgi:NIPSNAP